MNYITVIEERRTMHGWLPLRRVVSGIVFLAILPMARGQIDGTRTVTGGTVSGIGGDRIYSSVGITCRAAGLAPYNGVIQCLLDLGSAKRLEEIFIVNATNTASNINCKNADILVAADENAPGFTYSDPASYTVLVFSGTILPNVNTARAIRKAALTGRHKRRYYLINHTQNRFGDLEIVPGTSNDKEIRFHDVSYLLAPPLGSTLVLR